MRRRVKLTRVGLEWFRQERHIRKGLPMNLSHSLARLTLLAACLAQSALAADGAASTSSAPAYPNRPIRMIVPQAPGSASDTVARIIATELTTRLKQQVVVDNRPGGALLLGLDLTSKSSPDGY